jgi:hypothetical protein
VKIAANRRRTRPDAIFHVCAPPCGMAFRRAQEADVGKRESARRLGWLAQAGHRKSPLPASVRGRIQRPLSATLCHRRSPRGSNLWLGLLACGSLYSPRLLGCGPMASCGFRPRLQRRARAGFSPVFPVARDSPIMSHRNDHRTERPVKAEYQSPVCPLFFRFSRNSFCCRLAQSSGRLEIRPLINAP